MDVVPSFIAKEADKNEAVHRRLRSKRRPWVVCCYASVGAQFDHARSQWRIPKQQWRRVTTWVLIDFKVFRTYAEAQASRSYTRGYAPFSHENALVLLRHNTNINLASKLGTVRLY